MTWKLFEQLFPSGITTSLGVMTASQLRKRPEIAVINVPENELAREMITLQRDYILGKNDEYAVGVNYDIYGETKHPDVPNYPLSVYGQAMLNNYLYFHPEVNI